MNTLCNWRLFGTKHSWQIFGTKKYFCWRWRKVYGCELTREQELERWNEACEQWRLRMIALLAEWDETYRGRIESWPYERVEAEHFKMIREQLREQGIDPETGERKCRHGKRHKGFQREGVCVQMRLWED